MEQVRFAENEIRLIKEVKKLLENNKSKEEYSIFDVEEVGQKEVIMCRVLADFLDPNGKHNQGDIYLNNFYAILKEKPNANGIEYSCKPKDKIQIIKERATESDKNTKKRIDIVINNKTQELFLPIEVKINADEQQDKNGDYEQCQFYLDNAKNMYGQNGNARLVFLTKDGREPKTINVEDDKNKIICLSWEEDIINWIDASIKITKDLAIISILKQFKLTIQKFTYNMQDKEFELIKKFIVDDKMETACKIKNKICEYKKEFNNSFKKIINDISGFTFNNSEIFFDKNKCINDYLKEDLKNEGFVFGKLEDGYGFGIQLKTSCKENEKRNELLFEILSNFDYDTQEDWGIWINKINFYDLGYEIKENNYKCDCESKDILEHIQQINNKINNFKNNFKKESKQITNVETDLSNKDILFYADKIAKVYERINTINYVLEEYFKGKGRIISSSVSGNYVIISYKDKEIQFNFSKNSNDRQLQAQIDKGPLNEVMKIEDKQRSNPYENKNSFEKQIQTLIENLE